MLEPGLINNEDSFCNILSRNVNKKIWLFGTMYNNRLILIPDYKIIQINEVELLSQNLERTMVASRIIMSQIPPKQNN